MKDPLRLGIIGISEGNGHPYSWAAIFNGYDKRAMATCPFPVIPDYLRARTRAEDYLTSEGRVTHIWTQDTALSRDIARASRIEHIVHAPEEMLGHIDALLLARDDAEHHRGFAEAFLRAGLPVYVDKPLALTPAAADALLGLEQRDGQVFSCSALRYAPELCPTDAQLDEAGEIHRIEGVAPKSWSRYAMHIVEPALALLGRRGLDGEARAYGVRGIPDDGRQVDVELSSGIELSFLTTGSKPSPIALRILGSRSELVLTFRDSFTAFRGALASFVESIRDGSVPIDRRETRRAVEVLSWGL